jgi:hypothetical protein
MEITGVLPILLISLVLMPAFWWFIVNMLGKMAGMEKNIDRSAFGIMIKDTGYGSARINWVNFNGCIKILCYEKGYLFKAMPIFGGFEKWIPKGTYEVELGSGSWFGKPTVIRSKDFKIALSGKLAREFSAV